MEKLRSISLTTADRELDEIADSPKGDASTALLTAIWGCMPENATITEVHEDILYYDACEDESDNRYFCRYYLKLNGVPVGIHRTGIQRIASVGEMGCFSIEQFLDALCHQCGARRPPSDGDEAEGCCDE